MIEKKIARSYGRGCLVQLIIAAVVGPVAGAFVVAALLLLRDAQGPDDPNAFKAYAVLALLPILLMAGSALIGYFLIKRRARTLDAAFASWQLQGRQAGAVMRGWHGAIGERAVDIWFSKGPTLEIYLQADCGTRGIIHREHGTLERWAGKLSSNEPLAGLSEGFEGFKVYAQDEAWMRQVLDSPNVAESLNALTGDSRVFQAILAVPNAVVYRLRYVPQSGVVA